MENTHDIDDIVIEVVKSPIYGHEKFTGMFTKNPDLSLIDRYEGRMPDAFYPQPFNSASNSNHLVSDFLMNIDSKSHLKEMLHSDNVVGFGVAFEQDDQKFMYHAFITEDCYNTFRPAREGLMSDAYPLLLLDYNIRQHRKMLGIKVMDSPLQRLERKVRKYPSPMNNYAEGNFSEIPKREKVSRLQKNNLVFVLNSILAGEEPYILNLRTADDPEYLPVFSRPKPKFIEIKFK